MKGIIPAVPTPVDQKGMAQKAPFMEHCRWALANGCDGLNVLGTTGEANSFGIDQRKEIMGWAVEAVGPEKLMVGTGLPSLDDTLVLTRAADELGYSVALILPPFYYKPVTEDGLFAWYMALDAALGSKPIEIYFYNFPQMTGVPIPVSVIARLAKERPQRFTGIKDSSGDLAYCRELVQTVPGLKVFPSSETSLTEMTQSGFAGCISATVNISASLCASYLKNPDADKARRMGEIRAAISANPLVPAVKYLVGARNGDTIWRNVLPPFIAIGGESATRLERIAAELEN